MRISGNSIEAQVTTKAQAVQTANVVRSSQGSTATQDMTKAPVETLSTQEFDNKDETKVKVKEAVNTMNDMLEANHNTSKFMFHEGLDRYYVTVVDSETEEVVKEIPPKKLLDAFYEMQKMLGMIVDEKI